MRSSQKTLFLLSLIFTLSVRGVPEKFRKLTCEQLIALALASSSQAHHIIEELARRVESPRFGEANRLEALEKLVGLYRTPPDDLQRVLVSETLGTLRLDPNRSEINKRLIARAQFVMLNPEIHDTADLIHIDNGLKYAENLKEIFNDPNDPTKGFSSNGRSLLEKYVRAIMQEPAMYHEVEEILKPLAEKGKKDPSRIFFYELDKKIKERIDPKTLLQKLVGSYDIEDPKTIDKILREELNRSPLLFSSDEINPQEDIGTSLHISIMTPAVGVFSDISIRLYPRKNLRDKPRAFKGIIFKVIDDAGTQVGLYETDSSGAIILKVKDLTGRPPYRLLWHGRK